MVRARFVSSGTQTDELLEAPVCSPRTLRRRVKRAKKRAQSRHNSSDDDDGVAISATLSSPSASYRLRPVNRTDQDLVSMAHDTRRRIQWDTILHSNESGPARWKWQEHNGDFSIFIREDAHKYAVLAIGIVPGSVAELVNVMHATNNGQYLRKMDAIYGDDFRDGCFVYNVDMEDDATKEMSQTASDPADDGRLVGLSVKTATFNKSNWLTSHHEWCYLDAVYQQPRNEAAPAGAEDSYEKLMTSLPPHDIIAGLSASRTKYIENVVSGYLLEPEGGNDPESTRVPFQEENATNPDEDPEKATTSLQKQKMTRVHFYSELTITTNQHHIGGLYLPSFSSTAADKAVKHRLLKMARSCARFPLIIRRRRLGVQTVIDTTRVFPPTNVRCIQCEKFLLVAKMCLLCGQGVCQACSHKHHRETLEPSRGGNTNPRRVRLDRIRVCDICIERVDRSNYSYLTNSSLATPRIVADPTGSQRASAVLKALLQEAYANAETDEKKASVLSVIKCVIDQEVLSSSPFLTARVNHFAAVGSPGVVATRGITNDDILEVLEFIDVKNVHHDDAELAHTSGRGYIINPNEPDSQSVHPMPSNEAERLQAITEERLREMGNLPELNIICDIAANEINCFATMITVIDQDVQLILGANLPDLREARFPRSDTFCSHIIMDNKPLVVPHPEADIRFHQSGPVQNFGARFYCGFPIFARDNDTTVLGSLCCVDFKSHELTESQYTSLEKLAQTASRLVRKATRQLEIERQGKQQREEDAPRSTTRHASPVAAAS